MIRIFFLSVIFLSHGAWAQKQLVVLKRGEVVFRYVPGDDFVVRLKGEPGMISSYVNNLSDTAVVIHSDTIPFHLIDRLYFPQHSLLNTVGAFLTIGGAGIFIIDQFNEVVVHGNEPSFDERVNRITVSSLVVGLPMFLIRKKSQRIGYKYRLLMVEKDSPFYLRERSGMVPYGMPGN